MERNIRIFRKTQRKRPPTHHPLLALDIENNSKTGKFINAAIYGEIKEKKKVKGKTKYIVKHIEAFFTSQKDFLQFLEDLRKPDQKEIPTKIILFNASYDYWFLMKITKDGELLTNGSNIINGKLRNGIPIMDLTNLTRQGSLEAWIGYLKMKDPITGIPIVKESLNNLEARVKSDAKATWVLGNYLENFFTKEIGIPLKLTIAGAARYLFSLKFFNDYWYREEKDLWKSDYERKAYRGGRVEAFKGGKERVFVGYDINSMYLSVMRDNDFPDPNSARFYKNPKELPKDVLYISDVEVHVPKQYIGVLPILNPNNGKLIFPTGTFRGHFARPELDYAIKECGVKIIKIYSVMTYKTKPYFKDYANFIWKKRKEYKDKNNEGMDILIKYLGNVLYGGFGQKNKTSYFGKLSDFSIGEDSSGFSGIEAQAISSGANEPNHSGAKPATELNRKRAKPAISTIDGIKYITVTGSDGEDSKHTFPCIPVFITSYARLVLLKALRANADILIYTDTDSMKLRNVAKNVIIGDGLGEWGYEGVEIDVPVYKSKMYGNKCKGVPKNAKLVWNDKIRKIYVYEKPNKMKESFRRGLIPAKWKEIIKEVSKIDDKREWTDEKTSLPLVIDITQDIEKI